MKGQKINSYEDFEMVLTKKKTQLGAVREYLSDEGKTLYEALKVILFNMEFTSSFEDFKEEKEISKCREKCKDIDFIKQMNRFLEKEQ